MKMEARSLKFIARACAGELRNGGSPEKLAQRVCSDSRRTQPGDLFIALAGERFDGHDFLEDAAQKGAVAVVVERAKAPVHLPGCAVLVVDRTRPALGRLAARYRADFTLPILAVGGSNGKTTTKELIATVLCQKMPALWSEASFNNDIGVPLTLLRLENHHRVAVLEVGTNHPGELPPLVQMIQPKFGVLTSIGREHLEHFGSVAGVAEEEGWLAELLPADGRLFVNGDQEWSARIARRAKAAVVRVGLAPSNDWRAREIRLDQRGANFRVDAPHPDLAGDYRINLLGRHQVANALFAIALGAELGLGRGEIQRGLAECKPAKMRLQLWETNGVVVLDDAYNANADSMLAALQTLRELPCAGRRVAVLGDMAELGAHCVTAHEEIGRRAAETGVSSLFAIGRMAGVMARAARSAGLNEVEEFAEVQTAAEALKHFVRPGDVVLLKASRVTGLERVTEVLRCEAAVELAK